MNKNKESCHGKSKEKDFKWFLLNVIMKKEVNLVELIFVISFAIIFFFLFIWASTISVSFINVNEGILMLIIVVLIWTIYTAYLWRILKNVKKKKSKR